MTLTFAAGDEAGIIIQMAHREQSPYVKTMLQAFQQKLGMHVDLVLLADEVTRNQQCQQLTLGMAGKSHVVNINGMFFRPLSPTCSASQSVCNMS